MSRWSFLGWLICLEVITNSCEKEEKKNIYDMYRIGVISRYHRSVAGLAYVDDLIEFRKQRLAHGGLTWEDLKTHNFLSWRRMEFIAPGPKEGQVLVSLVMSADVDDMKEIELIDLDGYGAMVNMPAQVVADLSSVTRLIAGGWLQPADMDYPNSAKASLSALWSAVEKVEWEPLEKRRREWAEKYEIVPML